MSKQQRVRLYEGMYILKSTLGEEAQQKALERIFGIITAQGGEVKKLFDMGRRRLAYEIKENREGHYILIFFEAPSTGLVEINRENGFHEDLLRSMIIVAETVPEEISFKQLVQV